MTDRGSKSAWDAMQRATVAKSDHLARQATKEAETFPESPCTLRLAVRLMAQERGAMVDLMKQMSARIHALEEQATRP